jgi:hypothetical protein
VILDADLTVLYDVSVGALNQAVSATAIDFRPTLFFV